MSRCAVFYSDNVVFSSWSRHNLTHCDGGGGVMMTAANGVASAYHVSMSAAEKLSNVVNINGVIMWPSCLLSAILIINGKA